MRSLRDHAREPLCLVYLQGQRLLDKHVLAGLDRGDAEVDMPLGRGHDVDKGHMVERRPKVRQHASGGQLRDGASARGGVRIDDPHVRPQATPSLQMDRAEAAEADLQDRCRGRGHGPRL
jgi:hypothetical protein